MFELFLGQLICKCHLIKPQSNHIEEIVKLFYQFMFCTFLK